MSGRLEKTAKSAGQRSLGIVSVATALLFGSVAFGSLALGTAALGTAGCAASDPAGACRIGSDCPSGVCDQGFCQEPGSTTSTGSKMTGATTGSGGSASTSSTSTGSAAGGSGTCLPNHDGTITKDEVPIAAGLSATFRAAVGVTFATSGTDIGGGKKNWDLAQMFTGDAPSLISTMPLAGLWFEADYPGATYAAKLSEKADSLGVFEVTSQSLLLRGLVSPQGGVQKTELTFTPPVVVLDFPLTAGKTWSTDSTVTGYYSGVNVGFWSEKYTQVVDASGTLQTPFGDFDVLRVRTTLVRLYLGITTTIRSFSFATECFGTVASITATDNEPNMEFSNVSELRRLAP
jgi:hypothetical protein